MSKAVQQIVNVGFEPTSGTFQNHPPLPRPLHLLSCYHQLVRFQRSVLPKSPFAIMESGNLLTLKRGVFREPLPTAALRDNVLDVTTVCLDSGQPQELWRAYLISCWGVSVGGVRVCARGLWAPALCTLPTLLTPLPSFSLSCSYQHRRHERHVWRMRKAAAKKPRSKGSRLL